MSDELPLNIKRVKQLGGTPHLGFALRAYAACIEEGVVSARELPFGWDARGLVAYVRDEPAGVLVYGTAPWSQTYHVIFGFVLPDFRRRGIYRALFDELTCVAMDEGVAAITGTVAVGNKGMQAVMTRLGRAPETITYGFEVQPR